MAAPPSPPLSYGVLLYPGFEVLDVAGPLECLNTLADCLPSSKLTLSIIGRPIATDRRVPMPLSPANPNEGPPASQPSNSFTFKASQVYLPTHTFDTAPPLDVLILGGGLGSLPTDQVQPEMDFLQSVFPSLKYLFTVCTGSGIAARAGLLDGLRATSNKAVWKQVVACGPKTHWVARARWVVDGNMKVWTTSGVSAGVDGMVSFLRHVYPEEEHPGLVQKVVDYMEYRHEPDPSNDPFADVFGAHDVLPKA
ncbi:ThiJ/PfpI family protein [Metarhizium guizhouense ARSEF 977]|uniref:ThiJ/PfpI family protein n=1 Tax=Metarhizium guizhouense (strain ARSEF 977) TaxID=1276136 RepID=A0A0B4GQT3_METGA|nr:ThiJ/PfpI family protein [Metarhizium guizhouense ARSEF 977]